MLGMEDYDSLDEVVFIKVVGEGVFVLYWQVYSLSYGLLKLFDDEIVDGIVVIVNVLWCVFGDICRFYLEWFVVVILVRLEVFVEWFVLCGCES